MNENGIVDQQNEVLTWQHSNGEKYYTHMPNLRGHKIS